MSKIAKPSKKHHYVPQAQLRHFAQDSERQQIWVFDKQSSRAWISSIQDAGSENDFNTVDSEAGKWNFEILFDDVDSRSAQLISNIIKLQSVAELGTEDRGALSDLFATQMLRTKLTRTTTIYLAEQMREIVKKLGYDPDDDPFYAIPSERSVRLSAVKMRLQRDGIVGSMERLVPALFRASNEKQFILSDHPVVVANAFAYGDSGLQSHGIIVLLPIAPDLALVLLCPTIISRYEAVNNVETNSEVQGRIDRYRQGFRSGSPITIDATEMDGWNHRQVSRSTRFLYSAANEFDFARKILTQNPELKTINTHLRLGEMGRGPPARPGMQSGLQLVINGVSDHCIIAVAEINAEGEGLTARTLNIKLLELVASDQHNIRAELYRDGHPIRQIGQAMIERFGNLADGWFRVVHKDLGLRELARHLDSE